MPFVEDALAEMQRIYRDHAERQVAASRVGAVYDTNTGNVTLPDEAHGARLFALVHDLDEYQRKFWFMRPLVQYAMAQTGVAPDSQTARVAADIGGRIELESGLGFTPLGYKQKAGSVQYEDPSAKGLGYALKTALSGRGTLYGGSHEWGGSIVNPETGDSYTTRFGLGDNGGDLITRTTPSGIDFPLDEMPDAAAQSIREQAKQTIAELGPQIEAGTAAGPDRDRYFQAQGLVGQSDEEVRRLQSSFMTPIVPIARNGFMVLDAPLQEVQGQVRNIYAATHGDSPDWLESQSDLGVAVSQAGPAFWNADTGQGVFVDPASPVSQERLARAKERGTIGGHAVTLGRWAADTVFEPDTLPFNVLSGSTDLAVAIAADPANIVLAKYSKLKQADKMFTEAGGLFGLRRSVTPAAVDKFWDNPDLGGKVVDWVAAHDKTYDILEGFNRKLPVDIAHTLARTEDPVEIDNVLRSLSGGALREKPDPFGVVKNRGLGVPGVHGETAADMRLGVKRTAQQYRLNNIVPLKRWDLEDPSDAVWQTERFLRNVKAPNDMVYEYVDRMAGATSRVERRQVVADMMGGTKGLLTEKWGVNPELARKLTRIQLDSESEMRKYFVDEIGTGQHILNKQTMIGNTLVDTPSPHLLDEYIGRFLPMPDTRELRRVTSRYKPLLANKNAQQRLPIAAVNAFQDAIWKPAQLLRGAWTLRVIGEEQIRMAAAGMDSIFHHPLSAISIAVGHKNMGPLVDETATAAERWAATEEFQQAMTKATAEFGLGIDPHRVNTNDWVIVPKDPDRISEYVHGLNGELSQLHNDTISRIVARAESLDDAMDQVRGPGRAALADLAQAAEEPRLLNDPAVLRDYLTSIQRRISIKTGDHPNLLEAVRTGRLDGEPLSLIDQGRTQLNPKATKKLNAYLDAGPDAVKAPRIRYERGDTITRRYNSVVEFLFGNLMSRPTNYLSRSVAFKQFYYDRVPELLPLATRDAQLEAVRLAEAANVDKGVLKAMRKVDTAGELSLEQVDHLAKGHALDSTRNLLYDISEKSQLFDVLRLVAPFGEAWKEVLTRWASLLRNRPQNIRRLQQVIQGARGEGLQETISAVTGDPVNGGFFHKNEQGEEVFTYPGSTMLSSKLLGVPIPLVGRTSGLNLMGQIYPALGPMVSIPASWIIPDTPQYDTVRDILFPFGPPGSPAEWQTWAPPWMKRLMSPDSDDPNTARVYGNSVMATATYLASTGDYDLNTPEGMSNLMEDAKSKAEQFNAIRSVSQFFSPSAPNPDWLVEDKSGNVTSTAILATEYRSLQQQERDGQIPSANQAFLDRYGTEPFLVMQAKTQAVSYGYPTDSAGLDWMRNNPDLESKYPNVFGYFAPRSDDPNDFSYNAYLRALSTGAKKPLTLEQFVKLGMARLASLQYADKQRKVDETNSGRAPSAAQRAWLRDWRNKLIGEYPGYGQSLDGGLGLTERANKDQQIRELQAALGDRRVADTDAGQALSKYFEVRAKASKSYVSGNRSAAPDGWRSAKAAVGLRDWLRQWGAKLVREHPTFQPLWDQLLEREMADDLEGG